MTDTTDTPDDYLTITPFGVVHALFGYDPGVTLQGPEDAVACVTRAIEGSMNAMGIGLTLDSVEPADYFNFCQGHGTGVLIIEPTEIELLPPMPEEPQATEMQAALDATPNTDTPEPPMNTPAADEATPTPADDVAIAALDEVEEDDEGDEEDEIPEEDRFDAVEEWANMPAADDEEEA